MTPIVIPEDEKEGVFEVGAVTIQLKDDLVEISQDNGRVFPPTLFLSQQQAEQLRDQLINLFEVEK